MKEERMKILEMMKEDYIDAEEAAMLFKSLKDNRSSECDEDAGELSTKDFAESFRTVFKEIEPELKSASKEILEGIMSVLDNVSHSLNKKPDCGFGGIKKDCSEHGSREN